MRRIHYLIATALGSGYTPKAPGTAGSAAGLIAAWFFPQHSLFFLPVASVLCFFIGWLSADAVEKDLQSEDPSIVVIDEVAGMWISLLFVPHSIFLYLLAFGLFRLFDITKPWPIDNLQNLHGGLGIMLDDVVAGIYALAGMQLVLWLIRLLDLGIV